MIRKYISSLIYATVATLFVLGILFGWAIRTAHAALPPGFTDTLVTSVNAPTAFAFAPRGRLLITTQPGQLRVYQNGALLTAPALNLTNRICSNGTRGLLGIAVDPLFAQNHFIYLYYTFNKSGRCPQGAATPDSPVNRVSRFVLNGANKVELASETILINNIPQPAGHSAGDLHFGKDRLLYISVGDGACDYKGDSGCQGANDASRDTHVLLGKILRINRNDGIPAGNPHQGTNSARCNRTGRPNPGMHCQETFARGLRNPFRMAFDPNVTTTRFYINDTGQDIWEEIDLGKAGADYGWNLREGPCPNSQAINCRAPPAGLTDPIYAYSHASGCESITGGAFVPGGVWPTEYNGAYLYGD
jgi:glucose/arabinose dehydrogenase